MWRLCVMWHNRLLTSNFVSHLNNKSYFFRKQLVCAVISACVMKFRHNLPETFIMWRRCVTPLAKVNVTLKTNCQTCAWFSLLNNCKQYTHVAEGPLASFKYGIYVCKHGKIYRSHTVCLNTLNIWILLCNQSDYMHLLGSAMPSPSILSILVFLKRERASTSTCCLFANMCNAMRCENVNKRAMFYSLQSMYGLDNSNLFSVVNGNLIQVQMFVFVFLSFAIFIDIVHSGIYW